MKLYKIIFLFVLACFSCTSDFLDAKPEKSLVVPSTLNDLQALLDDVNQQINQTQGISEFATDEYVGADGSLDRLNEVVQNAYMWKRPLGMMSISDWSILYAQVLRANIVLEGLEAVEKNTGNAGQYDGIKGSALFFRAWHFFNLLQTYAVPFDPATENTDLGIILKIRADINEKPERSTVADAYARILDDLVKAVTLLPRKTDVPSRPNLAAGLAFLARVHLSRQDFEQAETYAALTLAEHNVLLDYNDFLHSESFPNPFQRDQGNDEVLFYSIPILYSSSFMSNAAPNPELYASYDEQDLRKRIYFKQNNTGQPQMAATYYGTSLIPFSGLTTSEMYLIRAECLARKGLLEDSAESLNHLLTFRWDDNVP